MVVFGNRKYACLTCIRGHRSSSCEHRDRILLQIRKPGRKPQAEPQGRFALVWTDNNSNNASSTRNSSKSSRKSKPLSEREYKLIRVPNVTSKTGEEESILEQNPANTAEDDDDVVITEKYMFVHIGDNLFRREVRPEYATQLAQRMKMESSPGESLYSSTVSSPEAFNPILLDSQDSESHCGGKSSAPPFVDIDTQNGMSSISAENIHADNIHSGNMPTENIHGEIVPLGLPNGVHHGVSGGVSNGVSEPHTSRINPRDSHGPIAPLVIGPMQFQNDFINQQANIFNELGITEEEASVLWPDNPANFSFASQCVLPGQCKCGDGCECPDCHEHNGVHRQHQH